MTLRARHGRRPGTAAAAGRSTTAGLGLHQGTALYLGAVLGPGALTLPALGAAIAGPASLLSWLGLLLLSVPVAVCLGAMAARFPGAGGISAFVDRALGRRAAAVVGWWFYLAVPVGVVAGALVGGHHVAAAIGLGDAAAAVVAGVLLALAFAANVVGLRVSGRVQVGLVAVLAAVLVVAVVVAAPHATLANLAPFAPHGWAAVGSAAVVLFYAVTGWEAASHLSAEFADPARDLPRVTTATLVVVAVLHLSLVLTTLAVLGARAGAAPVPVLLLLELGVGRAAGVFTALVAVLLTLGALNTFVAGAARLGSALGRSRVLPGWLAERRAGHGPLRNLAVQGALTASTLFASTGLGVGLPTLVALTSVLLAAVTLAGMLAAVRLLAGRLQRTLAVAGATATLVVLAFAGRLVLLPALVAGAGLLALAAHDRADRAAARKFEPPPRQEPS